jgi:predicted DNA-binding protein
MATKNPRINVTFDETIAGVLSQLALQEHKSVSCMVRELALEALEMREDLYLSRVAEKSDVVGGQMHSHEDVWK